MLSAGAALLAACGGDGGDSGGSKGGLIKQQPDRSKEARVGGTMRYRGGGGGSVDSIGSALTTDRDLSEMFHNRLMHVLPGVNEAASAEKVGDAAQSWEFAPDGLKLTFKIRQNLGTDPRPPLNGRKLNAKDVLSSWTRFAAESTLKADFLNSLNPDAPVTSVTTPDDFTVVFNLAFPSALLFNYLADGFYFHIMPREANEKVYDPKVEAHGAGPYYLTELLPGAHTKMARNPNYYDAPMPYYERLEFFNIPERAAQLAQFESKQMDIGRGTPGNIGPVDNDNVLDIYGRHQDAILHATPLSDNGPMSRFGYAPGSVFEDERVRQAISMIQDRAALAEVFTNETKLKAGGIPVTSRWATHITALWDFAWEDPQDSKSLQGNAKYFQYNVAEAKKLLEAASKLNVEFVYHGDNYIPPNVTASETLAGHINTAGVVKANLKIEDFASWSLANVYRGRGNYEGMFHGGTGFRFSPEHYLYAQLDPGPGTSFYSAAQGEKLFPEILKKVKAMVREFDDKKRIQLVKDIQVLAAKQMPFLPTGAVSEHFTLAWPWVVGAAVLKDTPGDATGFRSTLFSRFWYDEKLKT